MRKEMLFEENDIVNLTCTNIQRFFTYNNRAHTETSGTKNLLTETLLYNISTLTESSSIT